jgi:isopenicillin N synthase-like dioxygenase
MSVKQIPVFDLSRLRKRDLVVRRDAAAALYGACTDIGFVSIVNHGVPQRLIGRVRAAVKKYFSRPETLRLTEQITRENYRGYIPLGFFTPNSGSGAADHYEGYKLHKEIAPDHPIRRDCPLYGPNRWPADVADFRPAILDYWSAMDDVSDPLLRGFALGLGLEENFFLPFFDAPLTNMTLLHYPPQPVRDAVDGIHPHKDFDAFTIIAPDAIGGLQVRARDGNWLEANCPEGALLVNIGDMMELWSGGRLVSTPHKVVNTTGAERYSFPYFAVPRHDVTISPLVVPLAGFAREPLNVGFASAEIWGSNWQDAAPADASIDLGSYDAQH